MAVRWLRCTVLPGIFDTEFMVGIEVPGKGELTSIFVDKGLVRVEETPVRGQPVIGHVRVDAREDGVSNDNYFCRSTTTRTAGRA